MRLVDHLSGNSHYSIIDPAAYEFNRLELENKIIKKMDKGLKKVSTIEEFEKLLSDARNYKEKNNLEELAIIPILEERKEKLEQSLHRKEKMNDIKDSVVGGLGNAFGKLKGKTAIEKTPEQLPDQSVESVEIVAESTESDPSSAEDDNKKSHLPKLGKIPVGDIGNKFSSVIPKPQETKKCPQCGGNVKLTGKFCSKCGYRF